MWRWLRRPERRSSLLRRAMMEIIMAVRMTIIYSDGLKKLNKLKKPTGAFVHKRGELIERGR